MLRAGRWNQNADRPPDGEQAGAGVWGAGLGPARGVGGVGPLYTQSRPGSESALGFPRHKPCHTHSFQGPGGDLPIAPTPDPKHTVWDLISCLPRSVSDTGLLASSFYTCCSLCLGCCSPRVWLPDLPFSRGLFRLPDRKCYPHLRSSLPSHPAFPSHHSTDYTLTVESIYM